jgi:hypothetical protein
MFFNTRFAGRPALAPRARNFLLPGSHFRTGAEPAIFAVVQPAAHEHQG